jgi:hypothetical protein
VADVLVQLVVLLLQLVLLVLPGSASELSS